MNEVDILTERNINSTPPYPIPTPRPCSPLSPLGLTPSLGRMVTASGTPRAVGQGPVGWGSISRRRVRPTSERAVLAGRQLDKAVIWWGAWDLDTRRTVMEAILRGSESRELRFLMTVTQPWLHRDLMYWGHALFPHLTFPPLSTHSSRKAKENARRQDGARVYRVDSCHPRSPSTLPSLPSLPASPSILVSSAASSQVTETPQMHVRRHIQNESSPRAVQNSASISSSTITLNGSYSLTHSKNAKTRSSRKGRHLPQEAQQVLTWYLRHWNEEERQSFLHHLLLTLDPREHYFLSTCLMLRQHMDFLTQLPEHLALHVLAFFSPKELAVVSRVSKAWQRLANHNSVWEAKCRAVRLEVPVRGHLKWKRVFRDNYLLRPNWNQGRCRVTEFQGHKLSVLSVCLDEQRLVSGSADTTIRVWDVRTGRRLHVLTGHSKGVWCLQFFTAHLLLSGSYDSTVRIWNLRNGTLCRTLLGHGGPVWCLATRGHCLVSGSHDKTAKVWDIGRCVLLSSLVGHKAAVFAVDINEHRDTIYTGSADRTVRLWSSQTGECTRRIRVSGNSAIMSISVSQGYFACCHGTSICLYKGTRMIATFKEHLKRVETVKLRVDPETEEGSIVSGGQDGLCKYWDIHRPESIQTFRGHTDAVNCISFDEVRIVSASQDHKIRLWDFVL